MNAALTMPTKAEIPVAPSNEGHRGNAPHKSGQEDSPSFMSALRKLNDESPAKESNESRTIAESDATANDETVANPADGASLAPETILTETDHLLIEAAAENHPKEDLILEKAIANEKPAAEFVDRTLPATGENLTRLAADDGVAAEAKGAVASGEEKLPPGDVSASIAKPKTAMTTATEMRPDVRQSVPVHDPAETDLHVMQKHSKLVRPVASEKIVPSNVTPDGGEDLPDALEARIREQTIASNATKVNTARPTDGNTTPATSATLSETQVLPNAIGRANKKSNTMTDTKRSEPKVMVEAPTPEQTQSTEGQSEAKVLLDSTLVEKPMASNRFVRPSASDAAVRPEWLTPVDRVAQAPLHKASPAMTIAKEDVSLSTASFRENNIAQIVERVAVSVRGGQSEARIALKPDHLGSLRVQITTENNSVSVKIMTEFSMARDLLETHLPQLKLELQQQGLEVEKFDVLLSDDQQNLSRHGRQQQNASAARQKNGGRDENVEQHTDEDTEDHVAGQPPKSVGVDFFA
ncbi:MAG: flagellar hook-length control protein FliK [Desulfobacterales bacterium]|nr:flagellar hook-length control protein FliK [Desulfobacterales bacterium]